MPDAFGNLTPQEVLAMMQDRAGKRFAQAQATGNPGVQAGASLAAIFGRPLAKTLDTREARKEETLRLMKTQGISREEAEKQAKMNVGREFKSVRKAQQLQDASAEMQDFIDGLDPSIPIDMRMAQGKLMLSNRMRSMGLTTEANNLAQQATAEIAAAEQAALERENLKARTRASVASAEKTEAETPYVGTTAFMQNVMQKEQIIARLQDPNTQLTQEQRDSLLRAKGHLEAKIMKDETITGRTPDDVRNDPVLMRKLFADVADNEVLVNNIDAAVADLQDLDNFEKTFWANVGRDALGFMERWFGREPTESEAEFMQRVQTKEGKAALVAAKVRHALTGAQMSAFEIGFLAPFLPAPDDPVAKQVAKLRIVREYTQLDTETRMQLFQQGLTESWLQNAGKGVGNNPVNDKVATTVSADPNALNVSADNALDAAIQKAQQQ